MRTPPLFYCLHQWLTKAHKKGEIHESFYDGSWHFFSCRVRWDAENEVVEFNVLCLERGYYFRKPQLNIEPPEFDTINDWFPPQNR